jgi:hypothetical protein
MRDGVGGIVGVVGDVESVTYRQARATVGSNPTLSANSLHFVSVAVGSGGRSCVKASACGSAFDTESHPLRHPLTT